jgi:minor extracellular protease Epr
MVGVAPECKIATAKVLGKSGSGSFNSIHEALRYAKELKPDVINMSLGSHYYDPVMHKIIKELYQMNIPIIAASGNDSRGNAVNYPAKYPEVICVTAFDKNGKPARFNSTGPESEFSAPGVDIHSTWINNRYVSISGTSMATPFVCGVVALLIA